MFFEQNQVELAVGIPRILRKTRPDDAQTAAMASLYGPRAIAALKVLERHLAGRRWLVGDGYSVADISLFAYTQLAPEAGHELAAFPALEAWLQRVREQPGHVAMESP